MHNSGWQCFIQIVFVLASAHDRSTASGGVEILGFQNFKVKDNKIGENRIDTKIYSEWDR